MAVNNFQLFPNNIFPVEEKEVSGERYKLFVARFENIYDLHHYLTSNPKINRDSFRELSSETGSFDFAGEPYQKAVENLLKENDPGYQEFLQLQSNINESIGGPKKKYVMKRKVVGSHILLPAYSAGSPKCYTGIDKESKTRFIRMHIALSYYCGTSKSQVYNRAIITTNLLKALQNKGYTVDLHAFEFSEDYDELVNIVLKLKRFDGTLDMDALYKSLCRVEFLRRILFRVLETLDVSSCWSSGYGRTCSERFSREALGLDKNDIFIPQPSDLGIHGRSLSDDFESAIENLNIKDKIDFDKSMEVMRRQEKILRR